ncbi:MAG: pyruvate:ferredoxin (flavodoxin) oxidoreductase [Kiritimatiellia bacterium]
MKTMTDANLAVARVAYTCSDVAFIYPITPSSPMGEKSDEYAAAKKPNLWGVVPEVVEMQSEGGAAGAVHGAVSAGAVATTFTSSQGLLLMIPNLYRIAGELLPAVFHVAARALAVHGTCIFGDHSDVMACRQTGFAMLCSSGVQEAQDLALIAHAATLESRIPFLHFFDGFRTSHEVQKIDEVDEKTMRAMIDDGFVAAQRARGLNPEHPIIRGTVQNSDVYFQGREASNRFYDALPGIVARTMERFAGLTGRRYHLFDYEGAADAERVIVVMGSGSETVRETVVQLVAAGEKVGVVTVHLYRPFDASALIAELPATLKAITVLDRTKECGSEGEPLYLDVLGAVDRACRDGRALFPRPAVYAGRFGLGGKEFTPGHVKACFDNMSAAKPLDGYAVGVDDDVTGRSLPPAKDYVLRHPNRHECVFWGLGSDGTVGANKNSIKIIGANTDFYAQGYFVYDSKKAGGLTVSHLRFGPDPICSPYLCESPLFVACHNFGFLAKYDMLANAREGATFLLASPYGPLEVWAHLPKETAEAIVAKKINFYVIDAAKIAREAGMGGRINTVMQAAFFRISGILPPDEALLRLKEAAEKTYASKGDAVVRKNIACIEAAADGIRRVAVPAVAPDAPPMPPAVSADAPAFVREVTAKMMAQKGDELPVSKIPVDGTWPVATTQWEKRGVASDVPVWNPAACVQCGRCVGACPHAALRLKACHEEALADAPASFKSADARAPAYKRHGGKFVIQCSTEDCTGCGLCVTNCPVAARGAIALEPHDARTRERDLANWTFFLSIPEADDTKLDMSNYNDVQLKRPLFEFCGACAGCGEAPYIRLLTQICGERLLVANATGCSSVYAGNLPTAPYCTRADGKGVAWGNSLFEDNAEYGLGMRVTCDNLEARARAEAARLMLDRNEPDAVREAAARVSGIDQATPRGVEDMRAAVAALKKALAGRTDAKALSMLSGADWLVRKSVWLIGGDGWAYDIGFGGLDHALASGRNIKALVLDSEVYSNTGGQASKATPMGAVAKFAAAGRPTMKKNLGGIILTYRDVYVAQISLGANPQAAAKALAEADAYDGPALVIAYSHCVAHGIDMAKGFERQKVAVETGHFPLFRYDPSRRAKGFSALTLDSQPPSKSFAATASEENRFKLLLKRNPEHAVEMLSRAETFYRNYYDRLEDLTTCNW